MYGLKDSLLLDAIIQVTFKLPSRVKIHDLSHCELDARHDRVS